VGVGSQHHAPSVFPPVNSLITIIHEAGWVLEPVCTGVDNRKSLAPTEFRIRNRPAVSESLIGLRYHRHHFYFVVKI